MSVKLKPLKPCPFCGVVPVDDPVWKDWFRVDHKNWCYLVGHALNGRMLKQWNVRRQRVPRSANDH